MDQGASERAHEFFSQFPLRSYPKGQILLFAGENPDCLFYLVKGKVRKYAVSYRGDEMIVNIYKPPSFFPMSWAINRTDNKYYYKAEAPTEARIAPIDETLAFLKSDPEIMLCLLGRVYTGLEGILGRTVHLMAASAKSRVLYELLIECRRFGNTREDGSCWVCLHETDLAARAGLSRETVSREMHKLKKAGAIDSNRTGILVYDLAAIERMIEPKS